MQEIPESSRLFGWDNSNRDVHILRCTRPSVHLDFIKVAFCTNSKQISGAMKGPLLLPSVFTAISKVKLLFCLTSIFLLIIILIVCFEGSLDLLQLLILQNLLWNCIFNSSLSMFIIIKKMEFFLQRGEEIEGMKPSMAILVALPFGMILYIKYSLKFLI